MKNAYEVRGDVTAIFLNNKKHGILETLISTNKLTKAKELSGTWYALYQKDIKSFYAIGSLPRKDGKQKAILLHRFVTDAPFGMQVDHINHITLDNTNKNLKVCTQSENQLNRRGANKINKSCVRGVTWHKSMNKWQAQFQINKKKFYIGLFDSVEESEQALCTFKNNLEEEPYVQQK